MKFDPLEILYRDEDRVWVAGANHATRSDGSSSLMVAQAYGAGGDYPTGTVFSDRLGQRWCLTHGIGSGFSMSGIILEAEEPNVRKPE